MNPQTITLTAMPTPMGTRTERHRSPSRAERILSAQRLQAPATIANTARNARAEIDRHDRWAPAREALWQLLQRHLNHGARVAVLGAGNGDDLPLHRIAERSREVTLIDLDTHAVKAARRRQPRTIRQRIGVIEHDVTNGAAHALTAGAARAAVPVWPAIAESPLPGSPSPSSRSRSTKRRCGAGHSPHTSTASSAQPSPRQGHYLAHPNGR